MPGTRPRSRLTWWTLRITLFLVLALGARTASATPFDLRGTDWEGCSQLVELAKEELGTGRVEVVEEVDYSRLGPSDGLLLIHPQGAFDIDELVTFMKLGGRLAIIDDFGDGDRLLDRFRIGRSPAPTDPLKMLHGNPQLPVAVPSSGHPIVADVALVVLNHPTTLRHPELSSLLRIPRAGGDQGPDVALAGQVGDGRLVAIGDPSMLINSMIRFPGNRAVARNLVAYLLEGAGEKKREARLTIVQGRFKEKGTLGGGLTGGLRDRLRGLSGAIDSIRREGFGGAASRIVALGIAIAAMVWVIVRAGSRAKIPKPRYAGATPEAERIRLGVEDPRLSPLYAPKGRIFSSIRPTTTGVRVLVDALDAAVASRPELAAGSREDGVGKLASEAGLSGLEAKRLVAAFTRLRGAAVGLGRPGKSLRASAREVALLGRVLGTVADSLQTPR